MITRVVALAVLFAACDDAAEAGSAELDVDRATPDLSMTIDGQVEPADAGARDWAPSGPDPDGAPPDGGVADAAMRDLGPDAAPPDAAPPPSLEVRFLGVGGVTLRHGTDLVVTAPFYTNPDLLAVTLGEVSSDAELVGRFLDPAWVAGAQALLVGHGHYDHLLDVPTVWPMTGGARVYGNRSVSWLLAGVPGLGDHVVPLNDPAVPLVDRRMCPGIDACSGVPEGWPGEWVEVPDARVRLRALCSEHPPQFLGVIHFGEGCIAGPLEAPPTRAAAWLEGSTLAYLVDLLGPDGAPAFRVYYQDAPTSGPFGHVHPDVLAGRRVDLAVLNVGNFDVARDHPAEIIAHLSPRFVLGVHWEDFFRPQDPPLEPIPFHPDPAIFDAAARAALPPAGGPQVLVDGAPSEGRYWRPTPAMVFEVPPAP